MLDRLSAFATLLVVCAAAAQTTTTERQYLSGTDRDHTVQWEFFCTAGAKSGEWTTIPVPSCWDVLGFGNLRFYKDDDKRPIEQGLYRHRFSVPPAWSNKRVFLVFEGSMTDTGAKINGKATGPLHQGAFYRFKHDVTELVHFGAEDNLLEVVVSKHSADPSINRAERVSDYWLFGGIFRPVYLEAVPREHVERLAINARADGAFEVDAYVADVPAGAQVEVEVRDSAGQTVGTFTAPAEGSPVRVAGRVDNVQTWTAETPNLYRAHVRLTADGRVLHEVDERFGFRTIEVRPGDGVYINGSRVIFKGANRHACWPDSGRTLSPKIDRLDIELIKAMNMNAVRMSHYPPDKSFLELCDELGLYVINELAGWQKAYDAPAATRLVEEMIVRDVNHPSIVIWANGNEGGWNKEVDDDFAKWDPQARPVIHPWALHENLQTKHYPSYELFTQLLAAPDIYIPTEFNHGLFDGGHGAALRDYWDAMLASKVGGGGFVWSLFDEGVERPGPDGKMDVAGNAGPDGILGPYREKEGSFYTIQKIWSPVVLPDALPSDFTGNLEVINRYDFTSLDRVAFAWELRRWRGIDDEDAGHEVLATGDAESPKVAPWETGVLSLQLPADWREADALAVTAKDWTGREIWTWVWPVREDAVAAPAALQAEATDASELRSGDVVLRVDPATGAVASVTRGGRTLPFAGGPRLALGKPRGENAAAPTGRLLSATWRAADDGWFRLDYAYEAEGACEYAGVTFDLAEEAVRSARWLGMGPYRVWQNRLEGGTLGVWEKAYNDTMTGWSWEYPEFKGYHADPRWAKVTLEEGAITLVPETQGLYLHLLTPTSPGNNQPRHAYATFPDGSLSLLHAISAVGNKQLRSTELGPQSQPFQASGQYRGSVWVRFE